MQYDAEAQSLIAQMQNELEQERQKVQTANQNTHAQASVFAGSKPQDILQWQLDLREELDRLYHILCGHVIKYDLDGNAYWGEPDDYNAKSLTKYGVDQCMSIISAYLNRNVILSYYETIEFINSKMKDISDELTDKFFFEYEHMFYSPTMEELYKRDLHKIAELRVKYRNDATALKMEEWKLHLAQKEERKWILMKSSRNFALLHRLIVDTIHSAYLRGYRGEERKTIRQIISISESRSQFGGLNNPQMMTGGKPMAKKGLLSWLRA